MPEKSILHLSALFRKWQKEQTILNTGNVVLTSSFFIKYVGQLYMKLAVIKRKNGLLRLFFVDWYDSIFKVGIF